jgi:hypothetical protein
MSHVLNVVIDWFNGTFENYLSWRSLQWRWTALRTGTPFAEIVLMETLVYRVEQVFLIQPESGLLMQYAAIANTGAAQSPDIVSAMLIAVRHFVDDSFHTNPEQGMQTLRIGNLAVAISQGPLALLATVVRGEMPFQLRAHFDATLETIHGRYLDELQSFAGDPDSLAATRPLLESCLLSEYRPRRTSRERRQ